MFVPTTESGVICRRCIVLLLAVWRPAAVVVALECIMLFFSLDDCSESVMIGELATLRIIFSKLDGRAQL